MKIRTWITVSFGLVSLSIASLNAAPVSVNDRAGLITAAQSAIPGTVIRLEAGNYAGGVQIRAVNGTESAPIVIEAADPENPPLFSANLGGNTAIQLSGCSHIILRNLRVTGFPANGINADDGGDRERPSRGLRFENLAIENTGPRGNHDALKLSGLAEFAVSQCSFRGWGGFAIDMVGCHDGAIEHCQFRGREGFSQSNAVQIKGGSSRIQVLRSYFQNAGHRSVNLGGSTGLPYFRPPDATWEARDVEIAGNRFVGSMAPIAWVGCDNGHVHRNTIYLPEKWVVRILQENVDPRFGHCRAGTFEHNLIVFDRRVRVFANVGGNTQLDTFLVRHNAWFCLDQPHRRPTGLPGEPVDEITGTNPELSDPGQPTMQIGNPALADVGADAYADSE
tara:strand:- start:2706 stop:3884 length:1179 start_codon:yes stop_codon:yes gene_type:complete